MTEASRHCSQEARPLQQSIREHEEPHLMELVPPVCHQHNAAEVAIHNFKAHILSVLAGVANDFPPSLCDWLLPQTEITINLIRQYNATPNVSA